MSLKVTITQASEPQTSPPWTAPATRKDGTPHPTAGKTFIFVDQWATGMTENSVEYNLKIKKADRNRVFPGDVITLDEVALNTNARGTFHEVKRLTFVQRSQQAPPLMPGPAMPSAAPQTALGATNGHQPDRRLDIDVWLGYGLAAASEATAWAKRNEAESAPKDRLDFASTVMGTVLIQLARENGVKLDAPAGYKTPQATNSDDDGPIPF